LPIITTEKAINIHFQHITKVTLGCIHHESKLSLASHPSCTPVSQSRALPGQLR
jgi:hypothetical protein